MEEVILHLNGCEVLLLQIGKNYSMIPVTGFHSYACCGKEVILYHVSKNDEVRAIRFFGGWLNRIKTVSYFGQSVQLRIEVFTRRAGARIDSDFDYEIVDVL